MRNSVMNCSPRENPMTACFHWRHLPYLGLFLKHYEAEEEDRKFS